MNPIDVAAVFAVAIVTASVVAFVVGAGLSR